MIEEMVYIDWKELLQSMYSKDSVLTHSNFLTKPKIPHLISFLLFIASNLTCITKWLT